MHSMIRTLGLCVIFYVRWPILVEVYGFLQMKFYGEVNSFSFKLRAENLPMQAMHNSLREFNAMV